MVVELGIFTQKPSPACSEIGYLLLLISMHRSLYDRTGRFEFELKDKRFETVISLLLRIHVAELMLT